MRDLAISSEHIAVRSGRPIRRFPYHEQWRQLEETPGGFEQQLFERAGSSSSWFEGRRGRFLKLFAALQATIGSSEGLAMRRGGLSGMRRGQRGGSGLPRHGSDSTEVDAKLW